jgi:hypothetical protein
MFLIHYNIQAEGWLRELTTPHTGHRTFSFVPREQGLVVGSREQVPQRAGNVLTS